ncbi:type III secretion system export apparatus subunit SctT [Aquabacterium sp. A7-Y]|uniref:type III secretion system export apparatus subunit SctT n=1 Tax=Aquabacterium sp. A7-Y TaxID=1349605 RepID=UPI00223D0D46|nr:type III secretion system export apparatus subunit SctT [Aquabacterium sp. A7-Y]MCW7540290.1 type III secretion system export apparatus subunit SctT [Aquabacterium sp. A7-Y]
MHDLLSRPESIIQYGEALKSLMTLLALCSLRGYAAMLVMPPTSDQSLQGVVRNGLALMLGLFVAWGQPLHVVEGIGTPMLLALLAKEALLGLLLGFAVSVVFWVAEGVGALIDNQAGYNNAQQTNPLNGEQSTPVGNLVSQLAIAGFYLLGGMVVLVGLLFESFLWWPLDGLAPTWSDALETFLSAQLGRYMESVVKIAAPVLLVLVLIDLGFGIIGKTADKLEPNSLAQPVKGAVALLMLSLLVAMFFEQTRPALALKPLAQELAHWLKARP